MLVAILKSCAQDDPAELEEEIKELAKETAEMTVEEKKKVEEEQMHRREIIKNKIRAVGKVNLIIQKYLVFWLYLTLIFHLAV